MEKGTPRMAYFGPQTAGELPREEFGNKAANLARMAALGIPLPPGFSLGVSVCEEFHHQGGRLPADVPVLLGKGIALLENATGLKFGGRRRPLLVSVRSGAPVSMPGLMDTVLNVGLNRETVHGLILMSGNPRFAWDSYRRLMRAMGETVFGQDPRPYRALLERAMEKEGVPDEVELDSIAQRELASDLERLFFDIEGRRFPEDIFEQLGLAATAVIRSWKGPRAEAFRRLGMLKGVRGTAVTVQAMVFGNMGPRSGAGVAFTRDPSSGSNSILVDFKFGAQGEDVVSGEASSSAVPLGDAMPEVLQELERIGRRLEMHFREMQDIEFTVQEGKLYILQSRTGKRAPLAALRIAVEMVREGAVTPAEGLAMLEGVDPGRISIRRVVSPEAPLAGGEPASTGVATGAVALSSERAVIMSRIGPVVLVLETATPDDLPGLTASAGILCTRGVRTSHAAVVARQMGKVCIVGCGGLEIDPQRRRFRLGEREMAEGDSLTLDGGTGNIYAGKVDVSEERPVELLATVAEWRKGC
jgi:pyruvate,orthophosphate dikinase